MNTVGDWISVLEFLFASGLFTYLALYAILVSLSKKEFIMFLRAHGEEQKQQRVQQILDATSELYNEIGYDKVTFSKIAKKLDFSRINLYNYFSCKEDIKQSQMPCQRLPKVR